jgi:methyl-accepting chemotaxis protein
MVGVARQIAAGDLTRRVGLVARNEVGVLGRSFDDMTENLQTMLETERARKTVLERTVSDYLSFVEQVTSGDLAARLRTTVDDGEQETVDEELFRLAENLNTMAANLDGMVRREQDARSFLENTVTAYMHFVRQVADGDLTVRLALEANAKQDGDDDLYQLGVNLNAMVESLSDMARQVRETASSVSAAASEIQAVTAEQMASAVQQDATITETVATVEAVRATVAQTAERAGAVTRSSQQSVEVSRAGQEAVADSMEGMRAIQMRVVDIAENILLLSERTQQIGEIIETVNALAAQSKLLALNASIEAARAGEEGKGFAVVAMEVRQLAEQSRESTERVRDILNEIQQATNTAVMVTEEGSKDAETGITLVERAGVTIHELAGALEEAAQSAMQISASANQQTNGMDQLSAAMAEIKQASTQTAASTQQAERSMRDLLDTARQLEEAAARYKL